MIVKNRVSEYVRHLNRAVELSRDLVREYERRQKQRCGNGRKARSDIEAKSLRYAEQDK
ncbi:MAG: hypothetical protein GY941_29360 [Planctomycetes bacterium]|nr:hypothetical protein [Planctomycetota bacterium]